MSGTIITVRGPLPVEDMGITLPHEHVMVDFIGADKADCHRYDRREVVAAMLPRLREIREQGVGTFVDCTPMYLARDPLVLRELSEKSELNILTNTGQYKEPYLPKETLLIPAEQLAEQWIREFNEGIGATGIRPGFIKTAMPPGPMSSLQRKIIEAAAVTSRATGMVIATHIEDSSPIPEILAVLENNGLQADRWILVHAQQIQEKEELFRLGRLGIWIELDGIAPDSAEWNREMLLGLLEAGFVDRLLLSHDAGWYNVGAEGGGKQVPYTFLLEHFLPMLRQTGVGEDTLWKLIVDNPAGAFALGGTGEFHEE